MGAKRDQKHVLCAQSDRYRERRQRKQEQAIVKRRKEEPAQNRQRTTRE